MPAVTDGDRVGRTRSTRHSFFLSFSIIPVDPGLITTQTAKSRNKGILLQTAADALVMLSDL